LRSGFDCCRPERRWRWPGEQGVRRPTARPSPGAISTESEKSEQKGFANLLIGLFGAVRNPLAHAPKTNWPMSEQDALDILTLVSLIHRKLDGTQRMTTATT